MALLDYLVGADQQGLLYLEAKCLRRLQIDHEIKLGGAFNWQFGGLCALQNPVHVDSGAAHAVLQIWSIGE